MIEEKFYALVGRMDEVTRRLWPAVEARALGRGGFSAVARARDCRAPPSMSGCASWQPRRRASSPRLVGVGEFVPRVVDTKS